MKWRDEQPSPYRAVWLVESYAAQVELIEGWHIAGSGQVAVLRHMNIDTVKWKKFKVVTLIRPLRSEREGWCCCSAVQLGCSCGRRLLSSARGSRGQRGLETFLEGFFFSQQQLFWNEADVNNYWAKRSWRGGNRGGLAEFHLQSFGINWHTSKSRDVFFCFFRNKRGRTSFTSSLQLCSPKNPGSVTTALLRFETPQWKQSESAVSLHMGDCVNQRAKRTEDFSWECNRRKI